MALSFLFRWGAVFLPFAALPAGAKADLPSLQVPVRCRIGAECFVQNYVDRDPGPGVRDFADGRLTYDGHKGTDFRVPDLGAMRHGVAVVAAAPGVVTRVRDGEEDVSIRKSGGAKPGREAGNAVVVEHGNGWETQYSHLRRGSLAVKPGDRVEAGALLGEIGLSGNTEFPHVDFSVRHDGRVVDPFVGEDNAPGAAPEAEGLWNPQAREVLAYRPSGLIGAGFAAELPKEEKARDGAYNAERLPADTPTLGVWAEFFGGREGDRMSLQVTGPDGRRLYARNGVVPRPLAALFVGATVPKPTQAWTPGSYRMTVTLLHGKDVVIHEERNVELR